MQRHRFEQKSSGVSRRVAARCAGALLLVLAAVPGAAGCLAEFEEPALEEAENLADLVETAEGLLSPEEPAPLDPDVVPRPTPIVFVHGCPPPPLDSQAESDAWANMVSFFRAGGYTDDLLHVFVLPGAVCQSTVTWAAELGAFIDDVMVATRSPRVDIVAHSMGAPAARLYIDGGGHKNVRTFVSIAGGNHGSVAALGFAGFQALLGYPAYEGAKEMYPPYACQGQSTAADVQFSLNGCLTASGRTVWVDETPHEQGDGTGGQVRYLSIWNPLDEVLIPSESACLNQRFQNDCSDPVNVSVTVLPGPLPAHLMIMSNREVMQRVFDLLSAK